MARNYVPTGDDFAAGRVTNNAQSEIVRQRLYDWQLYPAAGQPQFSFFSQPIGQGVGTAPGSTVGSTKTLFDTNQEMGNTLPSGKSYLIESIEVVFLPGLSSTANTFTAAQPLTFNAAASASIGNQVNDVNTIYNSGMLEFNVLSKNILRETPLMVFPPKNHLDVNTGISTNSATTAITAFTLARAEGRPYYIDPNVTLLPAMNFEVLIRYPSAVALPSGFNGRICVAFDGFLMRASQ